MAGLRSDQRPVGAPVIERFEQSDAWRAKALTGIGEPQTGVGFSRIRGAQSTPFNRPNLPGRYDIRRMHEQNKPKD